MSITDFESEIRSDLSKGEIIVRFIKIGNDKVREMRCTTSATLIPKEILKKTTKQEPKPGLVVVWDTQKKGWRSFYVDRVEYTKVKNKNPEWKKA